MQGKFYDNSLNSADFPGKGTFPGRNQAFCRAPPHTSPGPFSGPAVFRRFFRPRRPIIPEEGGEALGGGVHRPGVRPERGGGLSACAGHGVSRGTASAAAALRPGRRRRGAVRRRGLCTGVGLSGPAPLPGGGGGRAGAAGLLGGGPSAPAGGSVFRRVLRLCRVRAGGGTAGGRGSGGAVPHGGGGGGAAARPGTVRRRTGADPCTGAPGGPDRRVHRPVGQRQRPAGSGRSGAGGVPQGAGPPAARGTVVGFDAGGPPPSRGGHRAPHEAMAGTAAKASALPRSRGGGGTAFEYPEPVDGGGGRAVSGGTAGPVPDRSGRGVHGPVGRRVGKGRRPWGFWRSAGG